MNTIIEWLIEQGYATNGFQSYAIFNGLKLDEKINGVHLTREQQEERCSLYRQFRPKGSKDVISKEAFELVLKQTSAENTKFWKMYIADVQERQTDFVEKANE